ncbi:FtsK/SpoIIIE domain-containing protein [Paramicrobacterium sp. CJ85]|uniref:FtsK/SpoIIIE domain-containing protein n=1 Tax=Paramicrobacterium sp. CJ85 TaxID=3445355 RepID=UPI003F63D803
MASIAPVIAAGAIWLITHSPYVLMFAILGPVIAIAGMLDNRISGRRKMKRDSREYDEKLAEVTEEIRHEHSIERSMRLAQTPTAREVLDDDERLTRWRARGDRRRRIVLGLGDRPSAIELAGAVDDPAHDELRRSAALLEHAPCTVDGIDGIGIIGPLTLARAVCRGYLVQLCQATAPGALRISSLPEEAWEWAHDLPHARVDGETAVTVRVVEDPAAPAAPADITLAIGADVDSVPAECTEIVKCVTPADGSWTSADEPARKRELRMHPITETAARQFVAELVQQAEESGILTSHGEPPEQVEWCELPNEELTSPTQVVLGRSGTGAVSVDLVEHGPHAVIGGTTGSGKSELLANWALSLASRNTPQDLALLLVDFKGGATFAPLQKLPHVVGVITDLDPAGATRALESLKAEVLHRERALREQGVTDAAEAHGLGRLVIIVDEFATMLDGFPELHALFVDIAARGRSLGMHLILCTQRPTGVVKDSLLANCTLRMSLRVNNRADSLAVIGVDTAARLPVNPPGRCVVDVPDREPTIIQVARIDPSDIDSVSTEHEADPVPRRPWLDPLPDCVPLEELPRSVDSFVLGMRDLPREQRQEPATWRPDHDGALLALGSARTGRSTLIAALEAQTGERWQVSVLSRDLEAAFDEMEQWAEGTATAGENSKHRGTVLAIDDLDAIISELSDADTDYFLSLLTRLLRTGPRMGLWVAATAQRLSHGLGSLAALFGSVLMLRLGSRQEHILAGGDSATFDDERRAGSATWNRDVVQLAWTEGPPREERPIEPSMLTLSPDETVLVSCARPVLTARSLRTQYPDAHVLTLSPTDMRPDELGTGQTILVGDSDAWQTNWSLLASLRTTATVVVESCSLAEYRAITRSRTRPPYLHREPGRAWRIAADGVVTRCRL